MKRDGFLESEVQSENLKKYILLAVIVVLIIISYFIIQSYIIALISAFVLAYLAKPLHFWLNKKISPPLSAIICIVLIVLVVLVPAGFIISSFTSLAFQLISFKGLSDLGDYISSFPFLNSLNLSPLNENLSSIFISIVTSTLKQIPSFALTILITLLGTFFILLNWTQLSLSLKKYIPFKDKARIAQELGEATHNIIYGYLLIAIIEFIIASVGFTIAGVNYPLIYASIIAIVAFIPGLGPGLVWGLLAIFHVISGDYFTAIGIVITGMIISIGVETLLFVKIVGTKSKIHPLILLVGVLGGVPLFGIFGFIIGPLVLVYTIKLLEEAFS